MTSVRKQIVSGVFFTALAKYSNLIFSLVVTAVLARLLTPEEFGVVAIASIAITFLNLLSDVGLSPAVIQHKELPKSALNNLFSLSCYLGVTIALLFYLSAGFLSHYYERDILKPICELLSINLFFNAIAVVPNALFYRERLFRYIAIRSLVIHISSGLFSVGMAYYGWGVYALIANPILSSILIFALSYFKFPLHFRISFDISSLRPLFRYSFFQFMFNIVNFISRNSDSMLVGKFMGMEFLGYYDKAYRLMLLPVQNVTQVITPVIHPILSNYKSDIKYLMNVNEKLTKVLALIGFPLSVYLYFSASEVVYILFGTQWALVIPVFEMLSFTIAVQLILSTSGSIFQTVGDTKSLFISGFCCAVLNIVAVLVGIFYFKSLKAVAFCIVISYAISFFQTYWLMYKVVFSLSPLRFFKILLKPLFFAFILGFSLWSINFMLPPMNNFLSLVLKGAVVLIEFIPFLWFGGYREFIILFKNKIRK